MDQPHKQRFALWIIPMSQEGELRLRYRTPLHLFLNQQRHQHQCTLSLNNLQPFQHLSQLLLRSQLLQLFHASRDYSDSGFTLRLHWNSNLHLFTPRCNWLRDICAQLNPVLERHGPDSEIWCSKIHRLSLWTSYSWNRVGELSLWQREEENRSYRRRKCWCNSAFVLAQMKVADIVLLDIFEGFAKGKALDMSQNSNVLNYDGTITGTADYNDISGSDVVVVTSGFPRKPGMSREDLIGKNAEIISQVGAGIKDHAPDSTVIMVTNPLDLMTYHMQKVTGFPANARNRSGGSLGQRKDGALYCIRVELCGRRYHQWSLAVTVTQWFHCQGIQQLVEYQLHN